MKTQQPHIITKNHVILAKARNRPNFNFVVKSSWWFALGSEASPKHSDCDAHDKPPTPDFQGIKSKTRNRRFVKSDLIK